MAKKAVEAHILRRIFATIRIKDWETDELTTTLAVAYHQDGIQAAIGPCVKICHNQCILSPQRSIGNYGKKKVTTDELFETVDGWLANFEVNMNEDIERIRRLKNKIISMEEVYMYIGLLTALRVSHDSSDRNLILRRDLSPEPRADFHIHRRGAETGHDKGTDYRLGSVQRGYRNIQARKDGLPGPHSHRTGRWRSSCCPVCPKKRKYRRLLP